MADSKRWLSRLEPVAQGPGGIGDELGAYWQGEAQLGKGVFDALVNGQPWGDVIPGAIDTYKTARGENRAALAEQQQAEPWTSVALEAVPQIPLAGMRGLGALKAPVTTAVKDLGMAARLGGAGLRDGVVHAMKAAALPGAIEGYGHSNATDFLGQAGDTIAGAVKAAGGAGLLRGGVNVATKIPFVRKALEALQRRGLNDKLEAARKAEYDDYLRNGKTVEMRHPQDPSINMRASGGYLDIDEMYDPKTGEQLIGRATQTERDLLEQLFQEKKAAQDAAERAAFRAQPRPPTGAATVPTRRVDSK